MARSRYSAALYLVTVFVSGILVGALGSRLYVTSTVTANNTPAPRTMAQYRARFLGEMKQKVGATDQQIAQITAILDDTKRKFDALQAEQKPQKDKIDQERVESIRRVFSPAQQVQYDAWRAERARIAAEKKKNSPPGSN